MEPEHKSSTVYTQLYQFHWILNANTVQTEICTETYTTNGKIIEQNNNLPFILKCYKHHRFQFDTLWNRKTWPILKMCASKCVYLYNVCTCSYTNDAVCHRATISLSLSFFRQRRIPCVFWTENVKKNTIFTTFYAMHTYKCHKSKHTTATNFIVCRCFEFNKSFTFFRLSFSSYFSSFPCILGLQSENHMNL